MERTLLTPVVLELYCNAMELLAIVGLPQMDSAEAIRKREKRALVPSPTRGIMNDPTRADDLI